MSNPNQQMNAIMPPPKLKSTVLIVQGPDGHSEEIDFGFLGAVTAGRVQRLLKRYNIRAMLEEREMDTEVKY